MTDKMELHSLTIKEASEKLAKGEISSVDLTKAVFERIKNDTNRPLLKVADPLSKIKELIKEGNVRKIIIKNEKNKVMMEIPVTFAVIGAFFAPVLAAVGALAALMTKCTIEVERK